MKYKKKKLFSQLVLILAFVVCGCMNAEMPPDMLNADAESISVVTAVQLGAEPGCLGVSDRISGNVTMMKLEEDAEMALIMEDGDPLCLDTIEVIEEELIKLEDNLQTWVPDDGLGEEIGDVMRQNRDADGYKQGSGGGGSDGNTGKHQIDPNPQPAGQVQFNTELATEVTVDYTTTSCSTPSNPNDPGGDVPSAPHGE